MLTFRAWKDIIVKNKRALNRIKNATIHMGFHLWVEYMCVEGPWWEPGEELQRLLEAKCSRFLAMMSGSWMKVWNMRARRRRGRTTFTLTNPIPLS
jgi:hypothetical protein